MFLVFQGLSDKTIKIFMSFALSPTYLFSTKIFESLERGLKNQESSCNSVFIAFNTILDVIGTRCTLGMILHFYQLNWSNIKIVTIKNYVASLSHTYIQLFRLTLSSWATFIYLAQEEVSPTRVYLIPWPENKLLLVHCSSDFCFRKK